MLQDKPFQSSTSNIPSQIIPKTNWALYTITVIISFAILILLNGGLTLSTSFLGLTSFTALFVFISLSSFIIGLIDGFILNKIAKSNKSFLWGTSIISFLCATIVSVYLSVQRKLVEKLANLETAGFGDLFGETPNPLLTGFLVIIFFNIIPLILYLKKEEKNIQELMIYFYCLVIFLILYSTAPLLLTPAPH